jgi:CRP-like cAMP-binding protein
VALEDDIRKLTRISLFRAMDPEALRRIAFGAETRILRAGDVLFRDGDKSDGGFIVLSGSVALDDKSDGSPMAHMIPPDSLIGETALLVETERAGTAIAREPSTVLKISRDLFCRVLRDDPQSAVRVRAIMAEELKSLVSELQRSTLGRGA